MTSKSWATTVEPAQLAFLAIYNPSLGPTDETFDQQVVFYYSRSAHVARTEAKKNARSEAAGGDALRAAENEKLRQIGLAQGMVDFAGSFSNGEPVDSIETERSRIVLRELEKEWWILASVDLTRLPTLPQSSASSSKKGAEQTDAKPSVEYSSREVSPPGLLLEQLQQAHNVFCLHHGPSLGDLFARLGREKFCSTLDRFWARFSRSWDVLLHGNPAVDMFSGLKLSSGGELGFGVGEEEWGSGERDVLEDLTRRTEGLVDVVASRFGEPAPNIKDPSNLPESELLPWMGSGREPGAADGVIFGGVGAIERHSLRDISLWMRHIYTYGDYAFGIRDNPHRERRKRRRRNPPETTRTANGGARNPTSSRERHAADQRQATQTRRLAKKDEPARQPALDLPKDHRPEIHPRVASRDHATTPQDTPTPLPDTPRANVPPPIASAVEEALNKATVDADQDDRHSTRDEEVAIEDDAAGTTLGIPDNYMKYLTFGLSTLGKPASKKRPPNSRTASTASSKPPQLSKSVRPNQPFMDDEDEDLPAALTQLQPMPDGETVKTKIATQKRLENEGYYLVGLKGDLNAHPTEEDADVTDGSFHADSGESRIVLRTVQVKVPPRPANQNDEDDPLAATRPKLSKQTSASETYKEYRRMRIVVYAHRPFIYCFLFESSTSSLSYMSFYRTLRQTLQPIHKPLLSSTSAVKVAQRIESSHLEPGGSDSASMTSTSTRNNLPSKASSPDPIFDLIYDPRLLTVHTSVPNIPEPGTPAAEGIFTTPKTESAVPGWTRIEAMNVHSAILNTLANVKKRKTEVERLSKTGRGWWIVWMKVPPSLAPATPAPAEVNDDDANTSTLTLTGPVHPIPAPQEAAQDMSRVAFLVRRSSDSPIASTSMSSRFAPSAASTRAVSNMFSNMTFGLAGGGRSEEEATGGASAGWGPQALTGGVGVDARKYVEGLLSLGR